MSEKEKKILRKQEEKVEKERKKKKKEKRERKKRKKEKNESKKGKKKKKIKRVKKLQQNSYGGMSTKVAGNEVHHFEYHNNFLLKLLMLTLICS